MGSSGEEEECGGDPHGRGGGDSARTFSRKSFCVIFYRSWVKLIGDIANFEQIGGRMYLVDKRISFDPVGLLHGLYHVCIMGMSY